MIITRNKALCIFYQLKYTEQNIGKAKKRFEILEDEYEICYTNDPILPVIALKPWIYGTPYLLNKYMFTETNPSLETNSNSEVYTIFTLFYLFFAHFTN